MTRVLVTGASGYIAKHVILRLLEAGHQVTGSVRSMTRCDEVRAAMAAHLADPAALDRLDFTMLDLEADEGWDVAMAGVDVLMHTASPFPMAMPRNENDLIGPAVQGTLRALRAAHKSGVDRVILTSSSAAVVETSLPETRTLYDETDWSDVRMPGITAYSKSKTLAERAAWDFVTEQAPGINLTTINPVLVLGPPLDAKFGTSLRLVARFLRGKDPMLPRVGFSIVDVRDVATMHLRALEEPKATAGSRFLGASGFLWFDQMALALSEAYPDRKITQRVAPDWLMRLMGRFDRSIATIVPALGREAQVSNNRARRVLGMQFLSPRESLRSSAAYLVDNGLV